MHATLLYNIYCLWFVLFVLQCRFLGIDLALLDNSCLNVFAYDNCKTCSGSLIQECEQISFICKIVGFILISLYFKSKQKFYKISSMTQQKNIKIRFKHYQIKYIYNILFLRYKFL